jgi:DNA-binding IclR family transcriptional regulator
MNDKQQGIQSVDAAMRVLVALAKSNHAMSLKQIAQSADMTASNTHRYMVSFARANLVTQQAETGHYDLGPFALQLGLAAMVRMDAIAVATKVMAELLEEIDLPVTLAVWTPDGPVMIRWMDASQPVTVNIKTGSRSPLLVSASGRIFLAYEAEERTRALLATELRLRRARKETELISLNEVNLLKEEVRRHGLGRSLGIRVSGINALGAPIFDATGKLALTLSSVGLANAFDTSYDGNVAKAVKAAAARASVLLGYRVPHEKEASSAKRPRVQ